MTERKEKKRKEESETQRDRETEKQRKSEEEKQRKWRRFGDGFLLKKQNKTNRKSFCLLLLPSFLFSLEGRRKRKKKKEKQKSDEKVQPKKNKMDKKCIKKSPPQK